jgi:hypothetical protein
MIGHCVKFRELHISLLINNAMILVSVSAENCRGWDEGHERSFRGMQ